MLTNKQVMTKSIFNIAIVKDKGVQYKDRDRQTDRERDRETE